MIYKGVQARLIQEATDGCLPETVSLRDPKILRQSREEEGSELAAKGADIDTSCYADDVREDATRVVRRGAVRVALATPEQKAAAGLDRKALALAPVSLAFRWVGQEHSSARNAYALDDISQTPMKQLHASPDGPAASSDTLIDHENSAVERMAAKPVGLVKRLSSASKKARRQSWNKVAPLVAPKRTVHDHARKHAKAPSKDEFPLVFQMQVDNQKWHIAPTKHGVPVRSNATITYGVRKGAFIELPALAIDALPESGSDKEVMRTVTLHVWNATRPGLRKHNFICDCDEYDSDNSAQSLADVEVDPMASHAPEAIFHFELITDEHADPAGSDDARSESRSIGHRGSQISSMSQRDRALYQVQEEEMTSSSEAGQTPSKVEAGKSTPPAQATPSSASTTDSGTNDRTKDTLQKLEKQGSVTVRDGPQQAVVRVDGEERNENATSTSAQIHDAEPSRASRNYPSSSRPADTSNAAEETATAEAESDTADPEASSQKQKRWTKLPTVCLAHLPGKKSDAKDGKKSDTKNGKKSDAKDGKKKDDKDDADDKRDGKDEESAPKHTPSKDSHASSEHHASHRKATEDIEERFRHLCGKRGAKMSRDVDLMDMLGEAGTQPEDAESVRGLEMLFERVEMKRDDYEDILAKRQAAGKEWRSIVRTELKTIDAELNRRIDKEQSTLDAIKKQMSNDAP